MAGLVTAHGNTQYRRSLARVNNQTDNLGWITHLQNLTVVLIPRYKSFGSSGVTTLQNGRWAIGISKYEPHARRRFTLAHELKHYIDGPRDNVTYAAVTKEQRELIANYFAACYLMPKLWLRRCWTRGLQDPEALAGLFVVSQPAMHKRLQYLGFIDSDPGRAVASYFRRSAQPTDLSTEAA